jgi:hypothetical protein
MFIFYETLCALVRRRCHLANIHKDTNYPGKDYGSLATHREGVSSGWRCRDYPRTKTTTHSPPRLRFFETPVSSAACLPPASSDGTKLGLERSTSKMTSGRVATRASAGGQTPRGGSLSFGARTKARKRFRYPNLSISCIQPPAHLAVSRGVGGVEEGAQSATWNRNKLVFLRNPSNSKDMAEARPAPHLKSTRCNTLISGRLSA